MNIVCICKVSSAASNLTLAVTNSIKSQLKKDGKEYNILSCEVVDKDLLGAKSITLLVLAEELG